MNYKSEPPLIAAKDLCRFTQWCDISIVSLISKIPSGILYLKSGYSVDSNFVLYNIDIIRSNKYENLDLNC